jgi:hypothetical protein
VGGRRERKTKQSQYFEPRNRFHQAANRFLGSLKGLQIRALEFLRKVEEAERLLFFHGSVGISEKKKNLPEKLNNKLV